MKKKFEDDKVQYRTNRILSNFFASHFPFPRNVISSSLVPCLAARLSFASSSTNTPSPKKQRRLLLANVRQRHQRVSQSRGSVKAASCPMGNQGCVSRQVAYGDADAVTLCFCFFLFLLTRVAARLWRAAVGGESNLLAAQQSLVFSDIRQPLKRCNLSCAFSEVITKEFVLIGAASTSSLCKPVACLFLLARQQEYYALGRGFASKLALALWCKVNYRRSQLQF